MEAHVEVMGLKARQTKEVERMLRLGVAGNDKSDKRDWGEQWKVLVYDASGRDIISPLMNVAELRKCGVTLHMMIDAERDAIPDVPAVYFCRPTPENVRRIAQDCSRKLYGSFHLNFISKLDRKLMEELAQELVKSDSISTVAKVFDQYIDFVSLEQTLFSLNMKDSYLSYNRRDIAESQIESSMRSIATSLYSIFATLGTIPIIRAPPNGPSEMVARQLSGSLNQAFVQHQFDDRGSGLQARPLLVILDRALDYSTILQHTSTYQALVDDVLDYHMNRVLVKDAESGARKAYDLEPETDTFWKTHAPRPFPEAIEENSQELQRIKEKEAWVKNKTKSGAAEEEAGSGTSDLLATVDSLPQLLERKGKLESHTRVLQAAMKAIAARDLPIFYEMEQADRPDRDKLSKLLSADSKGTVTDKLRLLAVVSLSAQDQAAQAVVNECEQILTTAVTESGTPEDQQKLTAGIAAIKHMKQLQGFQMRSPHARREDTQAQAPGSGPSGFVNYFQSKAVGFVGQVQSMLTKSSDHFAPRVVDNLCECRPGTEEDTYLMLDPKRKEQTVAPAARDSQRTKGIYQRVFVFMIGGGCYGEYQSLQDYAAAHPDRSLVYGATELLNAEGFFGQLSSL